MYPERGLPTSSYVILGMLMICGPMTPYELKKTVDGSIGYFWDFPRAQLYVDPARLVQQELLVEEREVEGRRRRTYHITEKGQAVLQKWLHEPAVVEVELRDTGLLKLYFGTLLNQADIKALALRERDLHRQRLLEYERIKEGSAATPAMAFALATLQVGLSYERLSITFWEDIAAHPPVE
jgi:PadR family transcriptional regulator AphA